MYKIVFTNQAQKDAKKIVDAGLKEKVKELLDVLEKNTFQKSPSYEKLVGDLSGAFSRRISFQHRLVYQVYKKEKVVKIIRMWTHYE